MGTLLGVVREPVALRMLMLHGAIKHDTVNTQPD